MAGRQYGLDEQQAVFGYVVWLLYFYGQSDWPTGFEMNAAASKALVL
jgi:hypothetical protein